MIKQQSMMRKWITFLIVVIVIPAFIAGTIGEVLNHIFGKSLGLDILTLIIWLSGIVWICLREAPGLKTTPKQ